LDLKGSKYFLILFSKVLNKVRKFMSVIYGGRASGINCSLETKGEPKTSNPLLTSKDEQLIL